MNVIGILLILAFGYLVLMITGIYQIYEGQVGLVKELGVLQKDLIQPGLHYCIPGYQSILRLNLMIQTDKVQKVPCGTANGLLVHFDKIQVVNRLQKKYVYRTVLNYTQKYQRYWITDKIHHQINQFCSKHTLQEIYIDLFDTLDEEIMKALNRDLANWAPGIEILSVRLTKPVIPRKILQNLEEMETVKVQYLISLEKQKVLVEERKTNQTQRRIKTESELQVAKITYTKELQRKRNQLQMARIEASIIQGREKTYIETQFLAAFEEATTYPQLYTADYLKYLAGEALTTNMTLTVGDHIPNVVTSLKQKKSKKSKK